MMQTLVAVESQHASAAKLRGVYHESLHQTVRRYSGSGLFLLWEPRGLMRSLKICHRETKALFSRRLAICYDHALRRLLAFGMRQHLQMRSKPALRLRGRYLRFRAARRRLPAVLLLGVLAPDVVVELSKWSMHAQLQPRGNLRWQAAVYLPACAGDRYRQRLHARTARCQKRAGESVSLPK